MESNSNNVLINLPFTLLRKIISSLDSLERIIFTLSCKRFFELRNKIIWFDIAKEFIISKNIQLKGFFLKSYFDIMVESLLTKKVVSAGINIKDEDDDYDFHCDLDSEIKDLVIPPEINRVWIGKIGSMKSLVPLLEKYPQITSLHISYYYKGNIEEGTIPNHIREIVSYNENLFDGEIRRGVLPEGLEIFRYHFSGILKFNQHSLPSTLHTLKLSTSIGHINALPPNLLDFSGEIDSSIDSLYIPPNIQSITGSYNLLCRFKHSKTLRNIRIIPDNNEVIDINFSSHIIPKSVSLLFFSQLKLGRINLRGTVPKTIKDLKLGSSIYKLLDNNVPFFSPDSDFNFLDLGVNIKDDPIYLDQLPRRVKSLIVNSINIVGKFQSGVEKLSFVVPSEPDIDLIPNTVTDLTLVFQESSSNSIRIPESVISLTVAAGYKITPYLLIPSTVKVLNLEGNKCDFSLVPPTANIISISSKNILLGRLDSDHYIVLGKYKLKGGILKKDQIIELFSNNSQMSW